MISIDVNSLNDLAEVEKALEKLAFLRDALRKAESERTAALIEQLKRDAATGAGLTYAQAYDDYFTTSEVELVKVNSCNTRKVPPFMDPQEAIQDDGIVCLIDGKKRKFLARYVRQVHSLEWYDYLARYDLPADYPRTCRDVIKQRTELAIERGLGKTRPDEGDQQVQVTVPIRRSFGRRGEPQVSVKVDIGDSVNITSERRNKRRLREFL